MLSNSVFLIADAKNSTWSFAVEDYNHLGIQLCKILLRYCMVEIFVHEIMPDGILCPSLAVDSIQKECKHIEMNLIPKAVIKLFQHYVKSTCQNKSTSLATVGSTATDWTRVSSKLSSTLMQFQWEGVE